MERHCCLLAGVALVQGLLAPLTVQGKDYKGAEYRTKESFLYGRFEARMKAIGGEGMLASFFTYNDSYPSTPWGEIDIEILGRYADDVQFNTITSDQGNHVSHQFVNFIPSVGYHVYGFEWTPDYVAWFIDSVEVYRQTGVHIAALNLPQKMMMNVWIPATANWVGKWNDAVLPAFARYDWVRYASYTPGIGTVGTGSNFTPQWTDNLDSWDQTRWDKGSHTWVGNNCDLIPDNVAFQGGEMMLCLTKATATGYVDAGPPSILWARAEGDSIRILFSEPVDQVSAETLTNYGVAGATVAVTGAQLLPDVMTVLLRVPGLDTVQAFSLLVQNVRDRWVPSHAMPLRAATLIRQQPLTLPVKINVGDSARQDYLADQEWGESVEYGRLDGQANAYPGVQIAGTSDPEIYRSELSDLCEYKMRLPQGRYLVELKMAENSFTAASQRKMRLVVEGKELESSLDLVAQAGFRTAYTKSTTVEVTDGVLDVHMQGLVEKPLLNGITVTPVSTGIGEIGVANGSALSYRLLPCYPNPFNPQTAIEYRIANKEGVLLKVFDVLGRDVATLVNEVKPPGIYTVRFDGGNLASGVYFYRLTAGAFVDTKRLMLLR
jgi:Glycosyl hydrolases family 16/Malectin domain/Secretion system C-terminal sorting domain